MFTIYDSNDIPYINVSNEIEADYIAYYIDGYYKIKKEVSE